MKKIVDKLIKLINLKTIVTLLITVVFCILALKKNISGEQFLTIFTIMISYYFGKQHEKKRGEKEKFFLKKEIIELNEKEFDEKLYQKNIKENNFNKIENEKETKNENN